MFIEGDLGKWKKSTLLLDFRVAHYCCCVRPSQRHSPPTSLPPLSLHGDTCTRVLLLNRSKASSADFHLGKSKNFSHAGADVQRLQAKVLVHLIAVQRSQITFCLTLHFASTVLV